MLLDIGIAMLLPVGTLRLPNLGTCRYKRQHVPANRNPDMQGITRLVEPEKGRARSVGGGYKSKQRR